MKKVYIGEKELATIAVGETTSSTGTSTGNSDEMLKGLIEGSITSIDIPDGTTNIKDSTFYLCSFLTSVTIPDSVTRIGWFAFQDCTSLTSITIPNSVTHIYGSAFQNCTSLTTINYDGSFQEWNAITKGDNCFSKYSNITVHCTDGDFKMTDDRGTLS